MKHKTIEVVVQPSGELQIDAVGFSGADCEKATAFLEETLGPVGQKQRKPEYYRQSLRNTVQKVGL